MKIYIVPAGTGRDPTVQAAAQAAGADAINDGIPPRLASLYDQDHLPILHDEDSEIPLSKLKVQLCIEVDDLTRQAIATGFVYDGDQFSLSLHAQATWNALASRSPSFPVTVSTKGGGQRVLQDASDLDGLLFAYQEALFTTLQGGRDAKASIQASDSPSDARSVLENWRAQIFAQQQS